MRITTITSFIDVVGKSWYGQTCSMRYQLRDYDIDSCKNDEGQLTYNSVERWLCLNSGDFRTVIDFRATIGDGEFDCDWSNEESELIWCDCMYGDED